MENVLVLFVLSLFFLFFPLLPPLLLYPTFTQPLPTQSVLGDSRLFLERQEKMDRSIKLLLLLHLYNNTWTCPTLASQLLLYSFPDEGGERRTNVSSICQYFDYY